MFLLGHIGITIAIICLLTFLIAKYQSKIPKQTTFSMDIDFRIVIIAAIFPDIIDKIVGMIIFKEEIGSGRIFTHSMLVIGVISIFSIILYRLNFGHFLRTLFYISPLWIHLLLDRMWETPKVLFWPTFGISFPRVDVEFSDFFTILVSNPYILTGEILGSLIIFTIIIRYRLYVKERFFNFIKNGKLKLWLITKQ